MNFLKHEPIVFVIGNEYEIVVVFKENGLGYLEIDGQNYYENNSGVLSTEKNRVKIRIPQQVLDNSGKYTVKYRKSIDRKAYFSELGKVQSCEYAFFSIKKKEEICVYHLADIHYEFELAKKTAGYFGDKLDLLIINGDTAEVETEQNYLDVYNFLGEMVKGRLPILFLRGNHDTRGKCAELFEGFFPCQDKKFYYIFQVGCLNGVAFDCGEDKLDCGNEYGGVNIFSQYRKFETEFLRNIKIENSEFPLFAVGHICPVHTTNAKGDIFDIERETYANWNKEFERLKIAFMLCGHMHEAYVLNSDNEKNTLNHAYPVVIGSALKVGDLWGTALIISKEHTKVYFTDSNREIKETYIIDHYKNDITKVD